jgi:hypothetical protein
VGFFAHPTVAGSRSYGANSRSPRGLEFDHVLPLQSAYFSDQTHEPSCRFNRVDLDQRR